MLIDKKFFCIDENFYYLFKIDSNELVECVKYFVYVFEIDEIVYVLKS